MSQFPTIGSPLYPVIAGVGGEDTGTGVTTENLVRYAVGQPTVIDTNNYLSSWSYDENTGTLQVEYNAIASQIGPIAAPHFQWELIAIDGSSVSLKDSNNDAHFMILPLVTDISYSGAGTDRPSVAVGFSNTLGSIARGCVAVWNKTGASTTGASQIRYINGTFVSYSGLDTAPTANGIGTILTYDPRSIFNFNATVLQGPRASTILSTGDYDSGQEAFSSVGDSNFITSRYLDVWLGAAEWNGGSGAVPAGETISMTVAAITLPFFPRFLGSNFIKQP